jgi:hypothetical protein
VDAKDIFGEINVEKQTAVNTALRDNITISIKYRDETSKFAVQSGELYIAFAVQTENHAVQEETDVKVVGEITRSEVPMTALTAFHHTENQTHCVIILENSIKYKYKP